MMRRCANALTTLLALALWSSVPMAHGQEQAPATEPPAEPVPVEKPVPAENIYRTGSGRRVSCARAKR